MEVMAKFGLDMLSKVPSTSAILQPSKETIFDSFMNKGSDNKHLYKLGFYLSLLNLVEFIN